MRATRNPKHADRMIAHYADAYRRCVAGHWTLERYLNVRHNFAPPCPKLSRYDAGRVAAASRIYFDLVNGGQHFEWRLGYADFESYTPASKWTYGNGNQPTHGAHFWKGTDIPFNGWTSLDREGPLAPGQASLECFGQVVELTDGGVSVRWPAFGEGA